MVLQDKKKFTVPSLSWREGKVVMAVFLLVSCSAPVPQGVGLTSRGDIPSPAACPSSPNCVSTQGADPQNPVSPYPRREPSPAAQKRLRYILENEPRTEIITDVPGYLHAVQRSRIFKFPDDVELWFPEDQSLIHFRSASRLGYSDLGVNRKRWERIGKKYKDGG